MERSTTYPNAQAVNDQSRLTPQQRQWIAESGISEAEYLKQLETATRESLLKAQAEAAHGFVNPLMRNRG